MAEDRPVLDTIANINAVAIERSSLGAREHMLVRLAALVAVDAPPLSYLLNAGAAKDVGVTLEDVQGMLTAISPIVGTPRVVAAAGNIVRALGFAVQVAREEEERRLEAASRP